MKKILYLTAFALIISACGKEEPNLNYLKENILGTWKSECYYIDDNNNPINFNKATSYKKYDDANNQTITFMADTACGLTVTVMPSNVIDTMNYSYYVINDTIKITNQCVNNIKYEYSLSFISKIINNDILILADKGENATIYNFHKRKL